MRSGLAFLRISGQSNPPLDCPLAYKRISLKWALPISYFFFLSLWCISCPRPNNIVQCVATRAWAVPVFLVFPSPANFGAPKLKPRILSVASVCVVLRLLLLFLFSSARQPTVFTGPYFWHRKNQRYDVISLNIHTNRILSFSLKFFLLLLRYYVIFSNPQTFVALWDQLDFVIFPLPFPFFFFFYYLMPVVDVWEMGGLSAPFGR